MKEKLRLCKSFDELREGTLVVAKCEWCDGRHRGILTKYEADAPIESEVCPDVTDDVWGLLPIAQCGMECVSRHGVQSRMVYIVITGNDNEAEQAQGKIDESIRDSRRVRYEDVK